MTDLTLDAAQIRAALALLKWENANLAHACNITPQTVSNIKRGATRPHARILSAIRKTFESRGVEFLASSGTRLKTEGVDILQGDSGLVTFYELMFNRVSLYRGLICVGGVDERLFVSRMGKILQPHVDRMTRLVAENRDVRMNILTCEGDSYFPAASYATYRWQSRENFSPTAFYVFADYLALISFHGEDPPKIVLVHSVIFADAYRKQFMEQWKLARVPPKNKAA